MQPIIDFEDYRLYLNQIIQLRSKHEKGIRTRFAEALGCQPSYITNVLAGRADLSPEQAVSASDFFGHSENERDHFLLLVLYGRAGSVALKEMLDRQIKASHKQNHRPQSQFSGHELTPEERVKFSNHWVYSAITSLVQIKGFQSKEAISTKLGLPLHVVSEAYDFLIDSQFMKFENGKIKVGLKGHAVSDNIEWIAYSTTWRLRALQSVQLRNRADWRCTVRLPCNKEDVARVKEKLKALYDELIVFDQPKPDLFYTLCIDFFGL